ncbi:MAG TPA: ADOP family duplicated permease [Candidatus Acidoferrales bacterium]|nr:ADOP family duplicated permease [Candidatus Acidoferrales bacterium]
MKWSDGKLRIRALWFRRRVEDELEEELKFHLAMQTRRNLASGMSAPEATRKAGVQFGGFQQVKEECRDTRGLHFVETLWQDVRYALRGFRRTPGFALTVVATIALGLGLNTTVFTIFNAYVLQPLSVRDPHSLYQLTWRDTSGNGHGFTWQELQDFRKQNPAFSEVIGFDRLSFTRVQGRMMFGQMVTGNYFQMVGVNAGLGRTLRAEDDVASGTAPVVLSSTAWTNKFGGDPDIVGKTIVVHGYPLEVVGVARAGFSGLSEVPLDFWAPLSLAPQLEEGPSLFGARQPERIGIIGRLRHGFTPRQAEAALTTWAQVRIARRPNPENVPEKAQEKAGSAILRSRATTIPLDPMVIAALSPIIMGFGLVLLIACANVANMMLARAMARQREIGVRLAMGAARSRLIRQLLTESVLLALPAAIAGFGIAQATTEWGVRLMLYTLPRGYLDFISLLPLRPDARVFAFMLAAAVLSALLFGLAPAIQATRSNVMQAARGEFTTDVRPARMRDALVIGQVTVSVLLLVCAAVLLRASNRLQRLDVGLQTRGLVEMEIKDSFRSQVNRQLVSEPGAQSIAAASKVPLEGVLARVPVVPEHSSAPVPAGYLFVSPEYFQVFQVPILRGRNFTGAEARAGSAVAVISQATAQRLWPAEDALGKSFRIERNLRQRPSLADPQAGVPSYSSVRIIGIARDAVNGWVGDGVDKTCVYFPTTAQAPGNVLFVHVFGDPEIVRRKLDSTFSASLPGGIVQIHTMDEIRDGQLYPFRASYWVSAAIGLLALLLTLSGTYGVLSYLVTQRTKEIGIRVALGASTSRVAGLVLKQSLKLSAAGTVIGAMAALAVFPILAAQVDVFTFDTFDAAAYGMVAAVVIAASACAAWFPSRRAARIEPLATLRCD